MEKEKKFSLSEYGYQVTLGKFAEQADGAVWFQKGGTVLLATVTRTPFKEFPGFLPLTVEYRENFSAAGRIPGGYFKREGKSTEKEVLTARLIDRAIRPLFPEYFFDQLQVIVTVYSIDPEHSPQSIALLAASLAIETSSIPFLGPVGVVEVAQVNGEWIFNPIYSQAVESDVRVIVAGTYDGIIMVEGTMNEVSEEEFIDVLFKSHSYIQKQVAWQKNIQAEMQIVKKESDAFIDWQHVINLAKEFLTEDRVKSVFSADKIVRDSAIDDLQKSFLEQYKKVFENGDMPEKAFTYVFDSVLIEKITARVFEIQKRIDGRPFDQVRQIQVEVGLLPFTHGSALFKRGQTQALATATLGGGRDVQEVEDLMGNTLEKTFMLHYNFPPFSVGEVRPVRGPGRREIGHGNLALSAIELMIPTQKEFPYTIRIVVDVLESDGSTSMATVCGSTMALMDAGVPIRKMVSGVAMGLLQSPQGTFQALTDINGKEDAFGLMDFKVAGTEDGITAIQMDIKLKSGLSRSVLAKALEQAKKGRLYILQEMQKVMAQPKAELSKLVPQVVSFKVPTNKIGAIIGSGGKVIKEIIEKTNTKIDIDDDGTVKIYGHPGNDLDNAINWVKILGGLIEKGSVHSGIVKRVADFGIFVELAPGQDGLVHISNIPREMQRKLRQEFPVGSSMKVEVLDHDPVTGRISLRYLSK